MILLAKKIMIMGALITLAGCSTKPFMNTVTSVDLNRFMGDWYVIANIPTFIENDAYNAVETYRLVDDKTVATTFTFRKGGFEGPLETYTPKGFIKDETNAHWGMQFLWPIKADYRIAYLDENYSKTIIARQARDFVWVMARTPQITEKEFEHLKNRVQQLGYDVRQLQKVPQRWPDNSGEKK